MISTEPVHGLPEPRIVLFEPSWYGHQAHYLRLLAEHWLASALPGRLDILASPPFVKAHPELAVRWRTIRPDRLGLETIEGAEHDALRSAKASKVLPFDALLSANFDSNERSQRHWQIMNRHAERLGATHAVLMFLDDSYMQVAAHMPVFCPFSGIFFRPTFYLDIDEGTPLDRVYRLQEKFTLARALRHPQLTTMFCLDPEAVRAAGAEAAGKLILLPDPVALPDLTNADPNKSRTESGIDSDRKVLLFFGEVSPRKGLFRLLDGISMLEDGVCREVCLLIAGPINTVSQDELDARIDALQATKPLQIIRRHEHVPEVDVSGLFLAADLVVLPYQKHVGLSGVQLMAAAHGRPVLTQAYGQLGRQARTHALGMTVDTTDAAAMANALRDYLAGGVGPAFNAESAFALAREHDEQRFAPTFFRHVMSTPG